MSRGVRQKVIAAAAVAVLLAGGALAAVSATGQSNAHAPRAARHDATARELATAADYLGISSAQLRSELSGGRTLAGVAAATPGKSEAGLVAALVAAKQRKLDRAAIVGRLAHDARAKR
ncbi:MAG TPA: hypothetical protein VK761_06680, partial [Solirubrobacteraceae bacterium]|nr:hypothetical protein [Solirubrobacteraceae bacterium]